MAMTKSIRVLLALVFLPHVAVAAPRPPSKAVPPPPPIRCAVIGGMVATGFFPALVKRFEAQSRFRVEITVSGNKEAITPSMERGEVDLITMHASDAIANLVADGYAAEAVPWAKNELVIIGPKTDPARVRGLADAAEAVKRIVESKAPFVVPHSMGAQEVLRGVLRAAGVTIDETQAAHAPEGAAIAAWAAARGAYTVVGRIPFMTGKIPPAGLEILVQGDPRLRRPYLVAVANPRRFPSARVEGARALAAFLRSPETQRWIARFARDAAGTPPFFPISE
jgi:tungstate transport system substrate-binding protein